MNILAVADTECQALWDFYRPGKLDDYDLIISCGDLKSSYLSFLVTMAHCPVLYVRGNHDRGYAAEPPEGCDCIEDALVTFNGVRILGLGGCKRYNCGSDQYTEKEMRRRIGRLRWKLRRLGGVDIVVTHAAPEGLGDAEDPAHWGFAALKELLDTYHPAYLIHGHVHMSYGHDIPRVIQYGDTKIINAYERYTLAVPEGHTPVKELGQVIYKTKHKD